jgi:hypothetical protein
MACAHSGATSRPASYSYTYDIPNGWRKIDDNRYLLLTKESTFLQLIIVQNRPIGKSFRFTNKKIQKGMLPEEAAQIIIDELSSDQNLGKLMILDNSPASIKGHQGFKILYTYRDSAGQTIKTLYYGFIKEDTFFTLRYRAADQVYFQRDISGFRSILNTFEVFKKDSA